MTAARHEDIVRAFVAHKNIQNLNSMGSRLGEKIQMLRNWNMCLILSGDMGQALHLQIAQSLSDEIRSNRLVSGTPLPSTRSLAAQLGVNRKTVVQAYEELSAQGWIEMEARRGAFVSAKLPVPEPKNTSQKTKNTFPLLLSKSPLESYASSVNGSKIKDSQIKGWPKKTEEIIDFSDGVPDSRLVPFDILSRAFRHALITSAHANRLAYDDSRGSELLRNAIAEKLRFERGMSVNASQICIVRGSQMGIYLSARLLSEVEGCVVIEELSYPPAREAFKSFGIKIKYVAQDHEGMDIEALEILCRSHKISAVYTTPHHQFPTTCMLPIERRIALLDLAVKYNFVIIEDDYDHEFHFSHRPMLPLASMENDGRVIHIGSLSKVLAPGLRLGYIAAAEQVITRCATEILLIDRQGNALTELAIAELMNQGEIKRHIRRALKIYQQRRDHAVNQVRTFLPNATFSVPPGGLALWLGFDETIDIKKWQSDCLINGVSILPGQLFSGSDKKVSAIRMGYASLNESEFDRGLKRLSLSLCQQNQTK